MLSLALDALDFESQKKSACDPEGRRVL